MNSTKIFVIILFCHLSAFSQSSFKKYKDINTGEVKAYAAGIKIIKVDKSMLGTKVDTTIIGELKPKFNNGKYYLKFTTHQVTSWGVLSDIWRYCFFNRVDGNTCYLRLYLNVNDKTVIKLIGKAEIKNVSDFDAFDFIIKQKELFEISNANTLSIKFSTIDLDEFENFPYNFAFEELIGLRDFCEGMNINKKVK